MNLYEMTESQKELYSYMIALCEYGYAASWTGGLGDTLWAAVLDGPRDFGFARLEEQHITKLRELSDACDGWFFWPDWKSSPMWVPLSEWEDLYDPSYVQSPIVFEELDEDYDRRPWWKFWGR